MCRLQTALLWIEAGPWCAEHRAGRWAPFWGWAALLRAVLDPGFSQCRHCWGFLIYTCREKAGSRGFIPIVALLWLAPAAPQVPGRWRKRRWRKGLWCWGAASPLYRAGHCVHSCHSQPVPGPEGLASVLAIKERTGSPKHSRIRNFSNTPLTRRLWGEQVVLMAVQIPRSSHFFPHNGIKMICWCLAVVWAVGLGVAEGRQGCCWCPCEVWHLRGRGLCARVRVPFRNVVLVMLPGHGSALKCAFCEEFALMHRFLYQHVLCEVAGRFWGFFSLPWKCFLEFRVFLCLAACAGSER